MFVSASQADQHVLERMHHVAAALLAALQEISEDLAQVQQQMSTLTTERFLAPMGPVDAETAAALESGAAVPWNPPADTAAIIAADAAVAQEQALTGLQGVMQTWQQELLVFRQVGGVARHSRGSPLWSWRLGACVWAMLVCICVNPTRC